MALTKRVGSLDIGYDESVLEPRPWTEAQAALAAELAEGLPPGPLLELCSGTGHIGLLTALLARRDAVLVDLSEPACRFAELNAAAVRERGMAVTVRCGAMDTVLDEGERFPLVLADPPYIPTPQTARFPADPLTAIDGGPDGLDLARACMRVAGRHLSTGGALVVQLRDGDQARELGEEAAGLRLVSPEVTEVDGHGALLTLRRDA